MTRRHGKGKDEEQSTERILKEEIHEILRTGGVEPYRSAGAGEPADEAAEDAASTPSSKLVVSIRKKKGICLARLKGTLDLWNNIRLSKALDYMKKLGHGAVILDLGEVTACDITAIGALLIFYQDLKFEGKRLILVCPREKLKLYECVNGFTEIMEFRETMEDAIQELRGRRGNQEAPSGAGNEKRTAE